MKHDPVELERMMSELSLDGPIEPFLVFADWLQERGDPWGELIALGCQRELARLDDETYWDAAIPALELLRLEYTTWRGFKVDAVVAAADLASLCAEVKRPAFRFLSRLTVVHARDADVPALLELGKRIGKTVSFQFTLCGLSDACVELLRQTIWSLEIFVPHYVPYVRPDTFDDPIT